MSWTADLVDQGTDEASQKSERGRAEAGVRFWDGSGTGIWMSEGGKMRDDGALGWAGRNVSEMDGRDMAAF